VSTGGEKEPSESFGAPSRRTYYAEERTLLAWWRTGIATAAVALAMGGIVPKLTGFPKDRFHALGAAYGLLAIFFFVGGSIRDHLGRRAIAAGGYSALSSKVVVGATIYLCVLVTLTVLALF
jgi:uncharacterized membrane protein YidH (DUF202 family)